MHSRGVITSVKLAANFASHAWDGVNDLADSLFGGGNSNNNNSVSLHLPLKVLFLISLIILA